MRELTVQEAAWVSGAGYGDLDDTAEDLSNIEGIAGDYSLFFEEHSDAVNMEVDAVLPTVYVHGSPQSTAEAIQDAANRVGDAFGWAKDVYGNVDVNGLFSGIGMVGATIFAVAILPEALVIGSVAGVAALVTELAGVGLTVYSAAK